MIIKSIQLINFGTHSNTKLDNFSLLNTIVGENGCGKTWIFKAMKLVAFHENWPDDWCLPGTKKSEIHFELSNGKKIVRTKSKSEQVTILYKDNQEINKFSGKKEAKSFVIDFLGFTRLELEKDKFWDLNFIDARSTNDLTMVSDVLLYRRMSLLLGVDKVEQAKTSIAKLLRDTSNQFASSNLIVQELQSVNDSINQNLSGINASLSFLEISYSLVTELNERREKILEVAQHKYNCFHTYSIAEIKLKQLKMRRDFLFEIKEKFRVKELFLSLKELANLNNKLIITKNNLEKLNKISKLEKNLRSLEETTNSIKDFNKRLFSEKEKFTKLSSKTRVCPTCGQIEKKCLIF